MNILRVLTMSALLLPMVACGPDEQEEAAAQAEAEALAESLGNALNEAADEAAAEAEAEAVEAEAEAEAEAAPAPAGDGSTCEQAWASLMQMAAAMKKQLGGGDGVEEDAEKRAEFMTKCAELPAPVQQCMVLSYAMEHQAECEQYRDQLQAARN